jgi:hypothetical protein
MRAQKDLRLLAALDPFFNFDGLVVTAIDNLDPGLAALYEAIPFLFNPPDLDLPSLRCHAAVSSHYFFAVFADAFNALSETVSFTRFTFS